MKGLIDYEQLKTIVDPVDDVTVMDITVGNTRINFEEKNEKMKLSIGDQDYGLTEEAFCRSARTVGIPEAYVKKCPPSLIAQNLNHWYNEGDTGLTRFIEKEGKIIGVSPKAVQLVRPLEMLNCVKEVVGEDNIVGYHRPHADLEFIKIPVILKMTRDMLVDDIFNGGIYLQTSILGNRPVEVSGYLHRLVCSNGMISTSLIQKWSRRNISYSSDQWVKDAVSAVRSSIEAEFDRVKKLTEISINTHAADVMNSIFEEFSIPASLRKEIEDDIVNTGAATMYDVFNSVSKVATYSEKFETNPYMGRSLQMVAGELTNHTEICSSCHRVL